MGKHRIRISGHAPKQVLEVMVCSPWRQCWFMYHWCKRNCPQYNTMELVLCHHESRYIRYQYSYMIVERRTIPLWPNNYRQTELVSTELSLAEWTECTERDLKTLLLEAVGFVYNVFVINIFHVIGERITISLWHNKGRRAELIS